jgi:hypothetical protein
MSFASESFIKTPAQQIAGLTARVASLEAELAVQKGIVAALLKRIYGAKSEKMSHEQLLLEFLRDEAKKPAAAAPDDLRLLGEETSERLHAKPSAFTLEIISASPMCG